MRYYCPLFLSCIYIVLFITTRKRGSNGTEFDVGKDDRGVGNGALEVGWRAGRGGAAAALSALVHGALVHGALAFGGVGGIEPEHVGVVLVLGV